MTLISIIIIFFTKPNKAFQIFKVEKRWDGRGG